MNTEPVSMPEKTHYHQNKNRNAGAGGAVYGLGMVGAWIFYIGHATTFWIGVLGFLKGIVWPAFVVYGLLNYLHL